MWYQTRPDCSGNNIAGPGCAVETSSLRQSRFKTATASLALLGVLIAAALPATAAGNITIDFNAPYNLVVDSNVLSPSTYAPELGSVGAQYCNYGDSPLTDVVAYIGDFSAGTPGFYPTRDSDTDVAFQTQHPHLTGTGLYSLTHHGGSLGELEAVRYIGDLDVGQCVWQYWHFTYPRTDPAYTVPVWGDTNNPNDDLWLTLDVWGTSAEGPQGSQSWTMTMRNEISASANKIYPNGGDWFTDPVGAVAPGQLITTTGVNYDMGVINKGFDNDGDGIADFNAWLQPIGDASYDPSCFRLVKTSGQLTIGRSGGNPDYIYDFFDELYFTNLPNDNNGGTGVVYYTFLSLGGPCAIPMTPYQEVASGSDNEKFAGDYGIMTVNLTSTAPEVAFDKSVDVEQVAPGGTITYTMDFANTGTADAGLPEYGVPIVIMDSIPPDTAYVAGSAGYVLGFSPNNGVKVIFSGDGGNSWSSNEPSAATVTDIQWWLKDPLPSGAAGTGTVSFQVHVDSPYGGDPVIENTGYAAFGNSVPFAEDTVGTLINGTNAIGDFVWRDDNYDGVQDGGEPGIANITVTLYWDRNGDGVLDENDLAVLTDVTDGSGIYGFLNVPDGDFIVVADKEDTDLQTGYSNTTSETYAVTGLSGSTTISDADFGFGPSLVVDKTLTSSNPALEGNQVTYTIDVRNVRPSTQGACEYTVWAENAESPFSTWNNPANAVGIQGPDGTYASTDSGGGGNDIRVDTWGLGAQPGAITKVEAVMMVFIDQNLVDDDIDGVVYFGAGATEIQRDTFVPADFNTPSPPGYCCSTLEAREFVWDVTAARTWDWADFPNAAADGARLALEFKHTGAVDAANFHVDSIGFRITSDSTCGGQDDDMSLVPLTDDFDADLLSFVSASPSYDSLTTSGSAPNTIGTITWNNVGPLLAGDTTTISLVFTALEPPDLDADGEPDTASLVNTTGSTGATFYDGDPVNDSSDTVTSNLDPAGTIGDTIFNDNGGLLLDGTAGDGVQTGSEAGIANVTVWLYTDPNGDGDPGDGVLVDTQITDAGGNYLFVGVTSGNYVAVVDPTTLPGGGVGYTQTGDPDEGGTCSTCNNRGSSVIDYNNNSSTLDDDLTLDFGYQVPNTLFGNVWEDNSDNGSQEAGENGLSGITVELYDGSCILGSTCLTTTTDANGDYEFGNVVDGTYEVVIDTTTLPAGGTWTQTADPDATLDNKTTGLISVSGGNVYGAYDFGYTHTGSSSIAGVLYADWNGDATQQTPGEEGIENVTVNLYEDTNGDGIIDPPVDAIVATTLTAADGSYSFSNLPAGNFIVEIDESDPDLPPAWIQTEDPDELSICSICNGTASISLDGTSNAGTGAVTDIDFGYQPRGNSSIGDYIWNDADGDGIQDAAEFGITNVSIYLYEDSNGDGNIDGDDALIAFTTGDGAYLFNNLPAGDYIVDIDMVDPQIPTDSYGNIYVLSSGTDLLGVALTTTTAYLEADYGFAPGAVIGDTIWQDDDGNGSQIESEPGIANVTVWLYSDPNGDGDPSDGSLIDTQVTDANGNYLFTGIEPGNYVIVADMTDPDLPSTNVTGDPDGVFDGEYGLTVQAGKSYMFADFGVQPPGVVGDSVWIDASGDGIYDPVAEVGIANITVELQDGVCVPAATCPTTTTDANGYYTFGDVTDGSYTVHVDPSGLEIPANLNLTYDPDEGNPCGVCDAIGSVTITGGNIDLTIDFGYQEVPAPELVIDKDTSTPVINAGTTATYTISVRNYGTAPAFRVDISDILPGIGDPACGGLGCFTLLTTDNITITDAVQTSVTNPSAGSANLTWGRWDISPNGTVLIEFTVSVDPGTPAATYDNTASALFDSNNDTTQDSTIDDDGTQPQDADTPPSQDPEHDEDVTITPLPTLGVTKVSSAGGSTVAGATISYTMTVTNTGPGVANNVVVKDKVPEGTTYVASSATVETPVDQPAVYFADDFESGGYAGARADSAAWAAAWVEVGETTDPGNGNIQVITDGADLVVSMEQAGNGLYRQADISAATTAFLSFEYKRLVSFASGDTLTVEISGDGGTSWFPVTSIVGAGVADATYLSSGSFEISAYIATNTQVRFSVTTGLNNHFIYIDDVEIATFPRTTAPFVPVGAHAPSGLVTSADSYDLYPGETMTITFQVTVANPVPAGLTQIDNTVFVTSDEISTPLTASTVDLIAGVPTGSIGDTVFDDNGDGGGTASDGTQNGTEPGLPFITVILYSDPNGDGDPEDGVEIDRVLTDASGNYLFEGLPLGDYVVDIDEDSSPTNYVLTSGTEPFPVNLPTDSTAFLNADFGYEQAPPTPLPVTLASFLATGDGYQTRFTWSTETETGNVGFIIYGLVDGDWKQLNRRLISSRSVDSIGPERYSFDAHGVEADTFVIADIDVYGVTRFHGPIRLNEQWGSEPVEPELIPWNKIKLEHDAKQDLRSRETRAFGQLEVQFGVIDPGLYRVSFADLLANGIDYSGILVDDVALFNGAASVPIDILGNTKTFGPGTEIVFIGEAIESLYTDTNIYTLRVDSKNAQRVDIDETPLPERGIPTTMYTARLDIENDNQYSASSPNGDPWYDVWLRAIGEPDQTNISFNINNFVQSKGVATLKINLWGVTDWPETPDHHVVIKLNGQKVADRTFDGLLSYPIEVSIPRNLLVNNGNEVEISLPFDVGVPWDLVALDSLSLSYPRRLMAENGALNFDSGPSKSLRVSSLPSSDLYVYRINGEKIVRIVNLDVRMVQSYHEVTFTGSDIDANYMVADRLSMLTPLITPAPPVEDIVDGKADYLIISHPDFISGLDEFVRTKERQGFAVRLTDLDQIYANFSGGVVDPLAIRIYIARAAQEMGVRHVLLVGGDSYDYKDNLGQGATSFLPSIYETTGQYVAFAPADPLYGDINGDGIPEIAIGRFPVRTSAELESIIAKTLVYEDKFYSRSVIAASDGYSETEGVSFMDASNTLLSQLDRSWAVNHADIDTLGLEGAKAQLISSINSGIALAQYFGHSGPTLWSFNRLFTATDAAELENFGRPTVVIQWGCWNTYYVAPTFNTMGHKLMLSGDMGAAAVLGAATLTNTASDLSLGEYFLPKIVVPGKTIGRALIEAKQELAEEHPEMIDVLIGWTILGDPALVIDGGF